MYVWRFFSRITEDQLYHAARHGMSSIVEKYIAENCSDLDLAVLDEALFDAAGSEYPEVIPILLNAGANVNRENEDGDTPLFNAVETASLRMVITLLQLGANPQHAGLGLDMPLHLAVKSSLEKTRVLLEARVEVNAVNANLETPLFFLFDHDITLSRVTRLSIMKLLLQYHADVNHAAHDGITPLMLAVKNTRDDLMFVCALTDAGARVNDVDEQGNTALIKALEADHKWAAVWLMHLGADVSIVNQAGRSAKDFTNDPVLLAMIAERQTLSNRYTGFKTYCDTRSPAEVESIAFTEITDSIDFFMRHIGALKNVPALSQMLFDISNFLAVLSVGCSQFNQYAFDVASFQLKKVSAMLYQKSSQEIVKHFHCETEANIEKAGLALPHAATRLFSGRKRRRDEGDDASSVDAQCSSEDEANEPAPKRHCG